MKEYGRYLNKQRNQQASKQTNEQKQTSKPNHRISTPNEKTNKNK
jgi:hypothetical protein